MLDLKESGWKKGDGKVCPVCAMAEFGQQPRAVYVDGYGPVPLGGDA